MVEMVICCSLVLGDSALVERQELARDPGQCRIAMKLMEGFVPTNSHRLVFVWTPQCLFAYLNLQHIVPADALVVHLVVSIVGVSS